MNVNLDETTGIPSTYDFINNQGTNPSMIIILTITILLYYFLFASLGSSTTQQSTQHKSGSLIFLEILLWGTFICLFLLNGIKYFFDIDIVTSLNNVFSEEPEIDIKINNIMPVEQPLPEITYEKQVFHIPDNEYTYDDANAVCKAYGSRLANYDEIEKAYKGGGEWCGYGWSQDQLALYPTQKKTYEKLQKIKGHKHDCGRPGVNGGFIANKNVRFGANCYGYKPKITPEERDLMNAQSLYPKTKDELKIMKKIQKWKQKLPEILVAPFNRSTWSKI
jgi:hypothetical protein